MTFTVVATRKTTDAGGATTPLDTRSCKGFTVVTVGAATLGDSKGNTWVQRATRNNVADVKLWDCLSPAVDAAHTFTVSGAATVMILLAWTCTNTPAVDTVPTAYDFGPSTDAGIALADFTPSVAGCLVVGVHGVVAPADQPASYAGANGFSTGNSQIYNGGVNFGAGLVYQIQGAAALVDDATDYATWASSAGGVKAAIAYKEVVVTTITLTDVVDYRVIQRVGTSGTLTIAATTTATTGVEARVVLHGTSTEVVTWTAIAGATTGAFSGQLTGIPQGSWYNVQVRQADNHANVSNGAARFGVGCLFAIIGQSQGVHWFSDGTSLSADANAVDYTGSAGTGWAARVALGNGANAFANSVRAALGSTIPVALLSYAVGGTALVAAGDTGGNGYWISTAGGQPYTLFNAGMVSAGGKLEACVWMQGEQDGYSTVVSEATYAASLATLFARIRTDTGQAALPIVVCPLAGYTNAGPTDAAWEGIRRAQVTVGGQANNTLAAFNQDVPLVDGVHYTPTGYTKHGTRAARAARAALGLSSYARGPAITSAIKTAPTTIEVTLSHRGGTDFTPSSAITGFQVLDGGTPATISAAVRTNATKITLTLSAPLAGIGTLRYQYGMNPTVSAPVLDNTAETLPVGIESAASLTITGPIAAGAAATIYHMRATRA